MINPDVFLSAFLGSLFGTVIVVVVAGAYGIHHVRKKLDNSVLGGF